jgi:raffinose/stachyose/melibiose transport system permease protein
MTRSALEAESRASRTSPGAAEPPTGPGRQRQRRLPGRWTAIVLFLLPALVLFTLLVLVPILIAGYTSFYRWNGLGGKPTNFIGLDNFTRMFKDSIFLGDLWHGLVLVILSVLIQLPLALGVALLLNQKLRGRAVFRLLFFAPYVLSEVIAAVLFNLLFNANVGLAAKIFGFFGKESWATNLLSDPKVVLYTLFVVITWKYFGFHMILYLAGRQNIPNELIESAMIDGASPWQTFRYVTLPLLGPTIRISVFLAVIGALQLFDMVWVFTKGGPIHASETMAVTMFDFGFRRAQVGYATAISVAMFIISFIFAIFYQRFIMRRDIEGAITGMRDQR